MGQDVIGEAAKIVKLCTFIKNANKQHIKFPDLESSLDSKKMFEAYNAISSWPHYEETTLSSLSKVADWCGVKSVVYKDESTRFGLGSFKALGGAYAVATLAKAYQKEGRDPSELTVATATDGNHGRSVSWGAQLAGCKSKIFIHANVSEARERAMSALGADVVRINGNYEASLAACKEAAELNSWPIVSDTSWKGYRDTPMQIISVESHFSQCFLDSISNGKPTLVDIKEETLMAGLSCGEVSEIAWEILKPTLSHCMSIADDGIAKIMQLFANGGFGETSVEAGECSASGLAALLIAKNNPSIWRQLELHQDSTVLLIGTEGATDPILYRQLIGS